MCSKRNYQLVWTKLLDVSCLGWLKLLPIMPRSYTLQLQQDSEIFKQDHMVAGI